jgi:hypothetical protein
MAINIWSICIKKTEACVKSFTQQVQLREVFHTAGAGYDPFALESPVSAGLIFSEASAGESRAERSTRGVWFGGPSLRAGDAPEGRT